MSPIERSTRNVRHSERVYFARLCSSKQLLTNSSTVIPLDATSQHYRTNSFHFEKTRRHEWVMKRRKEGGSILQGTPVTCFQMSAVMVTISPVSSHMVLDFVKGLLELSICTIPPSPLLKNKSSCLYFNTGCCFPPTPTDCRSHSHFISSALAGILWPSSAGGVECGRVGTGVVM